MARQPDGFPELRVIGRQWSPHQDFYHWVISLKWRWFFALIAVGYVLLNVVFALVYVLLPDSLSGVQTVSFENAFFFSVQTMSTVGYGQLVPKNRAANIVAVVEVLAGIVVAALVTGITFAKFARPTARVIFTQNPVISLRDGERYLMFRMANHRLNGILEAQLRVTLLVRQITKEGAEMRRAMDIPLVRDRTALFRMTWTAMHKIDENSPFFPEDWRQQLSDKLGEIYLSLSGIDDLISQTVHARYMYALDDIIENAQFADVLRDLPDGTRELDYSKFHDIVKLDPTDQT